MIGNNLKSIKITLSLKGEGDKGGEVSKFRLTIRKHAFLVAL